MADHHLQLEHEQEERPTERGVDGEGGEVGAAELPGAEHRQRHHRLPAAGLDDARTRRAR